MALPYRWQWRLERWKSLFRGFFGGGDKQPRPQMCPACGTLVGIHATRCHECGTSLRFSLAAASRGLSRHFGGAAPVTTAVLILNIFMFGVSWMATVSQGGGGGLRILWGMDGETLYRLGASVPFPYLDREWFRFVTAMFLHGGLIHIGCNIMVLMDLGPTLEEVYGSARYLFLYVTTGIAGFVVSSLNGHLSVGASTALMGLAGLLLAITMRRGGAQMKALRSHLVGWIAVTFLIGFQLRIVDNAGHFGGIAAGFLLGKVFADRQPQGPGEVRRAYALGWIAGLVVIAGFVFMILRRLREGG